MKKFFGFLTITILVLSVFAVPVYALVKSDDTVIIKADEVVNDDAFLAGLEVIIEGTVNGDVYVGANRLSVRGTVNGDVIAGGNNIEITGTIKDDLRAGGNNISLIGAEIGDSVSVAGNELNIDGETTIGGGLIFGGRSLSFDGSIGRGAMIGAETSRLNGPVNSTTRIAATNITIGEDAVIQGNLYYSSDNEATIDGEVTGEIVESEGGGINLDLENFYRTLVVGFNIWAFFAALLVGGLLVLIWPALLPKAYKKFVKKPWPTVGWGAIAVFATIPILILMLITVIGIPVAFLSLIIWLLAIYFAKFFAAYSAGYWIIEKLQSSKKNQMPHVYVLLLIGLILYYLLRMIPFIGMLVRLATTIVGLGMMIGLYTRPAKKKA